MFIGKIVQFHWFGIKTILIVLIALFFSQCIIVARISYISSYKVIVFLFLIVYQFTEQLTFTL